MFKKIEKTENIVSAGPIVVSDEGKRIAELEVALNLSEAKVQTLEGELTKLKVENVAMADKLLATGNGSVTVHSIVEATRTQEVPDTVFTVKGVDYRFKRAIFRLGTQEMSALSVLENETILEEIIEQYPQLVQKIEK